MWHVIIQINIQAQAELINQLNELDRVLIKQLTRLTLITEVYLFIIIELFQL